MSNNLFWIWLQQQLGYASRWTTEVMSLPGGARFIFERTPEELFSLGMFPSAIIEKLADHDLSAAETVYTRCLQLDYEIITPDNPLYPKRLRRIFAPPAVLYCTGCVPDIDSEVCIGVVGTRNASLNGLSAAQELGSRLSAAGAVVVSGCAVGIDSAAQQGALSANGNTVGVLGCAIDSKYNYRSRDLRERIALLGALVTEYPPGTGARPEHFPQRNRIISGLSLGIAVIEAGKHSGSVITANLAAEQGRDVFVLSGLPNSQNSGIDALIRDGALPFRTPYDILSRYDDSLPHRLMLDGTGKPLAAVSETVFPSVPVQRTPPKYTDPVLKKLQAALDPPSDLPPEVVAANTSALLREMTSVPELIDEIAVRAGLSAAQASEAMLELELSGRVISHPGGRFSL